MNKYNVKQTEVLHTEKKVHRLNTLERFDIYSHFIYSFINGTTALCWALTFPSVSAGLLRWWISQ
jgi:hypothetical protein